MHAERTPIKRKIDDDPSKPMIDDDPPSKYNGSPSKYKIDDLPRYTGTPSKRKIDDAFFSPIDVKSEFRCWSLCVLIDNNQRYLCVRIVVYECRVWR